ncbi:hypothetical protein EG328_000311 [Venturia inaequalis]|uniref:Uncharacterized protein n=1 Tax=Venturia inaequalis TaxID=5025 RepID=A0A8H3U369_VENIN|nr:hypothetical protein EG328_000311 [Venturia inaequalis]
MSLSLITTIANQDLSSVTKRSKQPLRASYLAASIIKNHQHVETSKILRITYPSVESRRWTLTLPLTCVSITSVPLAIIEDKSKSDGISRAFALIQISWLFVQLTGRAVAHLLISTLELFTGSNGSCAVIGYLLWWSKPKEVGVPFVLNSTYTADEILERQKIFIDDPDLRYPRRYTYARHALGLIAGLLGGLSVVGWAFPFPTYKERFAWRFLSLFLPISAILIWQLAMEWDKKLRIWIHPYLPRVANTGILLLYVVARLYIIIEVFTVLQDYPATLYETVDWSNYLPHF